MVRNQQGMRHVRRFLCVQLSVTLLTALIFSGFLGRLAATSVLASGVVSMVPNAFFALMLFQYQGAKAAKLIVNRFYLGEALKLVLTMILFALVFAYIQIIPWVFFVSYMIVQAVVWLTPLIINNDKKVRP